MLKYGIIAIAIILGIVSYSNPERIDELKEYAEDGGDLASETFNDAKKAVKDFKIKDVINEVTK